MKKLVMKVLTITALTMLPVFLSAQSKMNIHMKNGTVQSVSVSDIDWLDWTTDGNNEDLPIPGVSSGDFVDLGLSVKWASCNLGASSPEEFGDFYSWGETKPKTSFSCLNYFDFDYNSYQYFKYNRDGKTVLDPSDDAAYVKSGGSYRLPTHEECLELIEKCTWTWTQQNGVNGNLVQGPSGKTIFLPATGWYFGKDPEECNYRSDEGFIGDYMSNELYHNKFGSITDPYAFSLSFEKNSVYLNDKRRVDGIPIRPVCK